LIHIAFTSRINSYKIGDDFDDRHAINNRKGKAIHIEAYSVLEDSGRSKLQDIKTISI